MGRRQGNCKEMKSTVVTISEMSKHGMNMSAIFWVNHDPKKCEVCKGK